MPSSSPIPVSERVPSTDGRVLLVVHGHRIGNADGGRSRISQECIARIRRAERVVRDARVDIVLFSGAGSPGHPSEARQMADLWEGPPLPSCLDELSRDTAENVEQTLLWAQKLGATELVVVSSWWHFRLYGYYSAARIRGLVVRHARSWRWDGIVGHLWRELRGVPELWRQRAAARPAVGRGLRGLRQAQRRLPPRRRAGSRRCTPHSQPTAALIAAGLIRIRRRWAGSREQVG